MICMLSSCFSYNTRYYVIKQVGKKDKELIKLFRQEIPRKIILLMLTGSTGDIYKSPKTFWESKENPDTRYKIVSIKELVELTK